MFVKVDIPFHAEESDSPFTGLLQGIAKQPQSITLPFIVRMNADGPEGPGWFPRSVGQSQFRLREHDMADKTALLFHHKVQLRDEIRIVPVLIQHKMLRATGAVHIPKGLPREIFHRTVIFGFFKSDCHGFHSTKQTYEFSRTSANPDMRNNCYLSIQQNWIYGPERFHREISPGGRRCLSVGHRRGSIGE